jgi:hypothetical protein
MADFVDSGVLFRNDRRTEGSREPEYTGTLDAQCEQCGHSMHRALAAWVRTARNGRKFFSPSFRPKPGGQPSKAAPPDDSDLDQAPPDDEDDGRF